MPYHRSKKVLFLPYLSFETKKSFLVAGGGGGWRWRVKSDFSVSLCPFLTFRHTDTRHKMDTFSTHGHKMDTELDNFWFCFSKPGKQERAKSENRELRNVSNQCTLKRSASISETQNSTKIKINGKQPVKERSTMVVRLHPGHLQKISAKQDCKVCSSTLYGS